MTNLVDPSSIEALVGRERHPSDHYGRVRFEWQEVFIMHSVRCLATTPDLRDCVFSRALDRGVSAAFPVSRVARLAIGRDPFGLVDADSVIRDRGYPFPGERTHEYVDSDAAAHAASDPDRFYAGYVLTGKAHHQRTFLTRRRAVGLAPYVGDPLTTRGFYIWWYLDDGHGGYIAADPDATRLYVEPYLP